jgi:hypothetical protein
LIPEEQWRVKFRQWQSVRRANETFSVENGYVLGAVVVVLVVYVDLERRLTSRPIKPERQDILMGSLSLP